MVSTRSKTAETRLEDFETKTSPHKPKSPPKANTSKKRKSTDAKDTTTPPEKRTKPTSKTTKLESPDANESKIIINRAPVLHLWSACVTHFIYPDLSWETCLSAGSAISTICAIAKGRSIGTLPEKNASGEGKGKEGKEEERGEDDGRKKKNKKSEDIEGDVEKLRVMQFELIVKDDLVLVGSASDGKGKSKGKPGSDENLKKKFGEEEYESVRKVFEEVLSGWKGEEEEVQKRAFGWYEEFRPDVRSGEKGWGRKGELDLGRVKRVVGQ